MDEIFYIILLVFFASATVFGGIVAFMFWNLSKKTRVLYLKSRNLGVLKYVDVADGRIKLGNKTFYVENVKALPIQSFFGVQPFYILRWDKPEPEQLKLTEEGLEGETISRELTPEVLTPLLEMKAITEFMRHKTRNFGALMKWLMIGGLMIVGIVVVMALMGNI